MGDIPSNVYTQQSKKNFLFTMLGETVFMLCMFGYFLCVTAAYSEDMHGPEEAAAPPPEEEEPPKSEKSASKKSEGSKKSGESKPKSAGEDKPEDPPAGGD